jgi:hypothetical protein
MAYARLASYGVIAVQIEAESPEWKEAFDKAESCSELQGLQDQLT